MGSFEANIVIFICALIFLKRGYPFLIGIAILA